MFLNILKKKFSEAKKISIKRKKKIAFLIGNTIKVEGGDYYFTPLRITNKLIVFGIVVFKENIAIQAAKYLDNKVDLIFVDSEKKIFPKKNGAPGNIERRVRENIIKSKIFSYKGNDLTVDSVNLLIDEYFNKDLRGVSGKKIGIIGCGNIGSKIALNLTEQGAKVNLNRRNIKKLDTIIKAINILKPKNTKEKAEKKDKLLASKNADVLIGTTDGKPVISSEMVKVMKNNSLIIDVGKGTIDLRALKIVKKKNIKVFRTDIFPSLEGLITKKILMKKQFSSFNDTKKIDKFRIISPGKLGDYGDIIVDNINKPKIIYGICNGKGDFLRTIPRKYLKFFKKIKKNEKI